MRLMVQESERGRGIGERTFDATVFRISELALNFNRAGYRHWDEVLGSKLNELRVYDAHHARRALLNGELLEEFMEFKSALGNHRRKTQNAENHTVQIVESTNFTRVFVIDGLAVGLIDSNSSFAMENLLLGINTLVDPEDNEGSSNLKEEDLRKDIDFLNSYFGLGIELKRVEGLRVEVELPDNVSVAAPVIINVNVGRFRGRPKRGAA